METNYAGRCACGAIEYHCTAEPVFSGNCHCKDCQRSSGSGYTPAMMFPATAVQISGTPKYFKMKAESGRFIERGFCPECGSQLFTKLEMMPDVLGVKAGTLNDGSRFNPMLDFYVASAQPWDHMNAALPKMPRAPQG